MAEPASIAKQTKSQYAAHRRRINLTCQRRALLLQHPPLRPLLPAVPRMQRQKVIPVLLS